MSATDDELGPDTPDQRPAPEAGELQLRKALSTMNDLEPPRDDLFVQRAVLRGRARTSRRRSTVFGAAAALLVVGGVGTAWMARDALPSATSGAGSAAGASQDASGPETGSGGARQSLRGTEPPREGDGSVPAARDTSAWFGALASPQTAAFGVVEQTLVTRWADVFSGAYAADPAGSRIVVAVTRHDSTLETLVAGAMPSPSDVDFVVVKHSYAEKTRVLRQISAERQLWRSRGVQVLGLSIDARTDTVAVLADEGSSRGLLAQRYGDLVRVVPSTAGPTAKLPGGTTLPTLQR
jgi:hypothetical protein